MADETRTLQNLIAENKRLSASIDNQTQALKEISSELKEVSDVIKSDLKSVVVAVTSPLENAINGPKDEGVKQLRQQEELQEQQSKQAKTQDKQTVLLEEVVNGIIDLKKSLLDGVKSGIGKGLGGLIALIASPIIFLVDFFKTLGAEIRFLNKLTGGRLAKLFKPIKDIFDKIRNITKNPKIAKIFNSIKKGAESLSGFMKGFKPIANFASKIGSIFGKIFLPITILMSVFDFVTGFMDGYDEAGILGGLEGGLSKLFVGLIGMPLDLLKDIISWIAGKLGFDGASKALDSFSFSELITNLIGGIFDGITYVFDYLGRLFNILNVDLSEFQFPKFIDLIFEPTNIAINFIKDLFGFGDPEKPFSLSEFIMDKVSGIFEWLKSLFTFDFSSIGENISSIGNIMSGLAEGGKAAVAAMLPGGESPGEAFNRVYNDVLNGGSVNNKASQLNQAETDRKAAEEEKLQAGQQSSVVANSGNTNINNNSSSTTNMVSQGMPDVSQSNNFNMDEALAMG